MEWKHCKYLSYFKIYTHLQIFAEGIKQGVANSILIMLNQIGTVSESIQAIK